MVFIIFFVTGCSGTWQDLAEKYPSKNNSNNKFLAGQSVVLLSPNHKGSHEFSEMVSLSLQKEDLFLKVTFPNGLLWKPIEIPWAEITSCYHKENDPGYITNLWVNNAEVEIGLQYKDDSVINYYKSNGIDIIDKPSSRRYLV